MPEAEGEADFKVSVLGCCGCGRLAYCTGRIWAVGKMLVGDPATSSCCGESIKRLVAALAALEEQDGDEDALAVSGGDGN